MSRVVEPPACRCGHLQQEHNIGTRRGHSVRTDCSVHYGPRGVPCGCRLYQPEEAPP